MTTDLFIAGALSTSLLTTLTVWAVRGLRARFATSNNRAS